MPEPIQIKLDLRGMTGPAFTAFATTLHTNFVKPENAALIADSPFTAAELLDLIEAFSDKSQQAQTHAQAGVALTAEKKAARREADEAVTKIARFLEAKKNITSAQVLGLGFSLKSNGTPPAIVAPEDLSATFGDVDGSISLHWNPVAGAAAYVVQYRVANANGAWQNSSPVTPSNVQLTGLTPGELYELRVCAVFAGQAHPGPACDTIEQRAA
jgi:hypothetical protein